MTKLNNADFFDSNESKGLVKDTELYKHRMLQDELYDSLKSKDFNFQEWMKNFYFFSEKYKKFLYSTITASILDENNDDTIALVMSNIGSIIDRIHKDIKKNDRDSITDEELKKDIVDISQDKYQLLIKLYDHCNLANTQRIVYNRTKEDIQQLTDESIKNKISEYEKDITGQLMGLVSIFTALSFVIFGGINTLSSISEHIKNGNILKIVFVADLWMICMTNVFMLFIKLICKITKHDISLGGYFLYINSLLLIIFITLLIFFKQTNQLF